MFYFTVEWHHTAVTCVDEKFVQGVKCDAGHMVQLLSASYIVTPCWASDSEIRTCCPEQNVTCRYRYSKKLTEELKEQCDGLQQCTDLETKSLDLAELDLSCGIANNTDAFEVEFNCIRGT